MRGAGASVERPLGISQQEVKARLSTWCSILDNFALHIDDVSHQWSAGVGTRSYHGQKLWLSPDLPGLLKDEFGILYGGCKRLLQGTAERLGRGLHGRGSVWVMNLALGKSFSMNRSGGRNDHIFILNARLVMFACLALNIDLRLFIRLTKNATPRMTATAPTTFNISVCSFAACSSLIAAHAEVELLTGICNYKTFLILI